MLEIRKEQDEAFEQAALKRFENHLFERVQEFWPDACAEMGEDETRRVIHHGVQQAERYGIDSQRQVFRYVNLMMYLGPDFDADPAYPWTQAILTDPRRSAEQKLDQLVERARSVPRHPELF